MKQLTAKLTLCGILGRKVSRAFALFILLSVGIQANGQTDSVRGVVRISGIYIDDEGNRAVDPFTQNLYDGLALSLQDFSSLTSSGLLITADARNVTLNNRDIKLGLSQSARWKVNLSERQSRRVYTFAGDKYTRRDMYAGSFMGQVTDYLRIFGNASQTVRRGNFADGIDPSAPEIIVPVDYTHSFYTGGLRIGRERRNVELTYRASAFDDGPGAANDQDGRRYRVSYSSALPRYERWTVNGGAIRYERAFRNRQDSIIANTGWGGVRYRSESGLSAKYSFIFDRTRRTRDLVATDNIQNAIALGKNWRQSGGVSLGVRYSSVDDVNDDVRTTGIFGHVWAKLSALVTAEAGIGDEQTKVESGQTLTGDRSATRVYGSITRRGRQVVVKARLENRVTSNDDINTESAFNRYGVDVTVSIPAYCDVRVAYDFRDGEYEYQNNKYELQDHSLSGDVTTAEYKRMWAGVSGNYLRSRQSADAESFSLTMWWKTTIAERRYFELAYTAYNHDQFDDPAPLYRRYYTANVAQASLLWEL